MSDDSAYDLGYIKLAAQQWPAVKPDALQLVMLHGWLDNGASFANLAPHLSDYTLTALDLAGHGTSDHRPEGCFYHLWDYALDTIGVLNTLPHAVWLVGHSMGGAVAMLVAALVPEKVRGLIVLDNMGPMTASAKDRVITMQRAMQKMLKYRPDHYVDYASCEDMIHARMSGFTELSYEAAREIVQRGAFEKHGKWRWRADRKLTFPSPFRMDEAAVEAYIDAIKCPTLALVAEHGVYGRHAPLVKKRADAFPRIQFKYLPGNHHFHLEPNTVSVVAEEIRRFIEHN